MRSPLDLKPVLKGRGFIATGNAGKLREMIPLCREYFEIEGDIEGLAPEGAVESADTFEGNAFIKARFLRDVLARRNEHAPFWILADDSGISVDDLDGRPGVISARYAGDHVADHLHMEKLVQDLKASGRPAPHPAHYTCALALIEVNATVGPTTERAGEGECHGEIIFTPQGSSGFGYDPVFFVPEFGKTFAEVSYGQKNSISHRRRAFEHLAKSLLTLFVFMGLFTATPAARADSLAKILSSWQNDGFIQMPVLPSEVLPLDGEVIPESDRAPEVVELLKLYALKLPKIDAAKIQWKSIPLSPELRLAAARPARSFFNTHLIQAFDGKKLLASFRPVDTTSGCESGCAPITFHLKLTSGSSKVELFEEAAYPLLKRGHVPLDDADRALLSKNLVAIPALMKRISSSGQTTDDEEQTWPLYSKTLVNGAAYTSYRVYEAAMQLLETLGNSPAKRLHDVEAADDVFGRAYRVRTLSDGAPLWKELVAQAGSAKTASLVQQFQTAALAAMVAWRFEEDSKSNAKKLEADIASAKLDQVPDFKCHVLQTLLLDTTSRARLKGISKSQFAACSGLRAEWVEILSSPSLDAALVGVLREQSTHLPEFVLSRPELLAEIASKVPASETALRSELFAVLKAEHPRFEIPKTATVDSKRVHEIESGLRDKTLASLSTQLGKFPSATLQKFEGTSAFPVKGKEVYIFFASWCPHCKLLLTMLNAEINDAKLWKRIQLVESLSSSNSLFEAQLLCSSLKLPKNVCDEMLLLPTAADNPELNKALNLTSVPRIVITDTAGQLRDFDFHFEEGAARDPLRKLLWILDNR
ncbi:MAG: non-canonical purine NTP pyrophosphatase [Bdellovibrionota bacterium]